MSCHDIGRGMNEVVRMTISLFDKGEISKEAATKIIATCGVAVNWCDGNEYEAIDYIERCRCGKCLKLIPKGEKLLSIWGLPYNFVTDNRINLRRLHLASPGLCEECFDKVLQPFCDDESNLEMLMSSIESDSDEERYVSEGAHPDNNNGFRWVRETDWFDV